MSLGWNQQEGWRCVCSCCLLPYSSCLSCAFLCARCQLTKERWHSKCSGWWPSSRTRGGKVSWSGFLPSTRVLKECESGILSQRMHSGCLDTQPPSSCWYCAQVLVERHFFSWMCYCFWILKLWCAALTLFINDSSRGKSPILKNKPWTFALEEFCALALPWMLSCLFAHEE